MFWRRQLWSAYSEYLLNSSKPILVGPWRSEVGFETLYWIPFLSHLRERQIPGLPSLASRMIPITRGGASAWYATDRSVELYELRTPQQVRVQAHLDWDQKKSEKQLWVTDFDRAIYADAAKRLGLTKYLTLHPAWMYQVLSPYWMGTKGLQWLSPRLEWKLIPGPTLPADCPELPPHFAAVKFYGRATFQTNKSVASLVQATVEHLASQLPVIVLSSETFADNHVDMAIPKLPNVVHLKDLVTLRPENNLALQSAILQRAALFVGPYGGFAQLAMRMGRPVVSYYDDWNYTCIAHKHLADSLATQFGLPFHVYRLKEIPWAMSVLPYGVQTQDEPLQSPQMPAGMPSTYAPRQTVREYPVGATV